jgi:bla regulator protein BlaR1
VRIALLFGVCLIVAQANGQPSGPRFEVASIRPSAAETRGVLYHLPGDRFRVQGFTLLNLISYAWDTPATEISGLPKWASSERFDIEATPEDPPDGPAKELESPRKKEMVRNLLQERFKLQMRAEDREAPVYALVAGGGPKLETNSGKPYQMGGRGGKLVFQKVSMAAFAKFLSGNLRGEIGRPVVDRTAIAGEFDFNLTFAPLKQSAESDLPSIFTACEQQLGLRLQPDRGAVRFWIVANAEPPSPN